MAKSTLVKANEQIAEGVIGAYRAVEAAFVGGYQGIENAFVDQYLTRDGESVEDAKARLRAEQEARQVPGAHVAANKECGGSEHEEE